MKNSIYVYLCLFNYQIVNENAFCFVNYIIINNVIINNYIIIVNYIIMNNKLI